MEQLCVGHLIGIVLRVGFDKPDRGLWPQDQAMGPMTACSAGMLPAAWGSAGGMQRLATLIVGSTGMSGPLPEEWGTQLPALQLLDVAICSFNGMPRKAAWQRSASPASDVEYSTGIRCHAASVALAV